MDRRRPLAALAMALATALSVAVFPRPAQATKEYAKQEGKDCSYCHINPKGSGPRNPQGREFEANGHRFGVKSWSSDANQQKFLRANSALLATWYGEAGRLLDELQKAETLPGGLALVDGTREKFKMFRGAWLRGAKKLLAAGDRGLPNALGFLVKLESQFGATDEGRDAVATLDQFAKDPQKKKPVEEARAREKVRLLLLEGRTEFQLGNRDRARDLLEKVLADPLGKDYEPDARETLARLSPAK